MSDYIDIFYGGDDPPDHGLARRIASELGSFGTPRLLDVDEMERADERGADRKEAFHGVATIFVLSDAVLDKPHRAEKVANLVPGLWVPWREATFYVCRGTSPQELLARHPELEELFDRVLLGGEEDLPEVVDSIRRILGQKKRYDASLSTRLRFVVPGPEVIFTGYAVVRSGRLSWYLYLFSSAVPPFLLTAARAHLTGPWVTAGVALTGYAMGYGLNRQMALDFWPWLGRRWKLDPGATRRDAIPATPGNGPGVRAALDWLRVGSLQVPNDASLHSTCTPSDLRQAAASWLAIARRWRLQFLLWLFYMAVAPVAVLLYEPVAAALAWAAGLLAGTGYPPLYYWSTREGTRLRFAEIGLTDEQFSITEQYFGPARAYKHVRLQSVDSPRLRRRWRTPADRVFISYGWRDEAERPVAAALARSLEALGVDFFMDHRNLGSSFAAWRSRVSMALAECTHVFLVLGPSTTRARGLMRELRMSLQRWHTELFPSLMCVVDPQVAAALCNDPEATEELRLALAWCPRLGYADASDPGQVRDLLIQRRRQGLLRDLQATLFPRKTLEQVLLRQTFDPPAHIGRA